MRKSQQPCYGYVKNRVGVARRHDVAHMEVLEREVADLMLSESGFAGLLFHTH